MNVKKLIKEMIVGTTLVIAAVTTLNVGEHISSRISLTSEQQKIVKQTKAKGYSEVELHFDITSLGLFNDYLKSAQKAIDKGDNEKALNFVITANGALNNIKILDIREQRVKLLEVRKELQKSITSARLEEIKKDKRPLTAEEVRRTLFNE